MPTLSNPRWNVCKAHIQARLGSEDAAAWLPLLEPTHVAADQVVLSGVPNSFFKSRIATKFLGVIREGLARAFPDVPFVADVPVELRVGPAGGLGENAPAALPPGTAAGAAAKPPQGLEPRLTFATFQEGEANRLALALARQVAAAPGARYNPLLLVGGSGLGKTHLLQALVVQVTVDRPHWQVRYATAEAFAQDVWEGIRRRRMADLRSRYRTLHLLALDDLEFLPGKRKVQEELLYTLDALHGTGRQLVFSARSYPRAMEGLDPALRSRLEMGLITELAPPDAETRRRIVQARASAEGLRLAPEAEALLVERITASPRQLEGALLRVAAYASLLEERVTADFVARAAAPCFDPEPGAGLPVPAERILGAVCDRFALSVTALRSRSRTASVVTARQVAAYLLREMGRLSFPEIGAALGNRSHSTMIHAVRAMERALGREPPLRRQVVALREELAQSATAIDNPAGATTPAAPE